MIPDLTRDELDALETAAHGAIGGRWTKLGDSVHVDGGDGGTLTGPVCHCKLSRFWNKRNARYIAEAQPRAVLPLISMGRQLLELKEAVRLYDQNRGDDAVASAALDQIVELCRFKLEGEEKS